MTPTTRFIEDITRRDMAGKIDNDPIVIAERLHRDGAIPNNERLPALIYRTVFRAEAIDGLAAAFEQAFDANGWRGGWRNGIFDFHHYHSTAHEVLGVYAGSATVQLGGEAGLSESVAAGDVIVVPAGVAHKRVTASADFAVVGAYAAGASWDTCRPETTPLEQSLTNIAKVPMPTRDPVYGRTGPLMTHWL